MRLDLNSDRFKYDVVTRHLYIDDQDVGKITPSILKVIVAANAGEPRSNINNYGWKIHVTNKLLIPLGWQVINIKTTNRVMMVKL